MPSVRALRALYLYVSLLLLAGAPAGAQTALSRLPPLPAGLSLPVPAALPADPCAVLPAALAAADASPYDAQLTACFDGLLAGPDYISPAADAPASGQLTGAENDVLFRYVDSYAYMINSALRKGENVHKYAKFIKRLNSALDKLPAYRGVTFRGSAYPPLPAGRLVAGAVFTDPAFLSTTRNLVVADGYAGADGYLSVILGRTGRSLSYSAALAGLESEMEVLFRASTRLRVIAVAPRPDGRTAVYLEQLP